VSAKLIDREKLAAVRKLMFSDASVDRVCFALCNVLDTNEVWAHTRRDPGAFREAVRVALRQVGDELDAALVYADREWAAKEAVVEAALFAERSERSEQSLVEPIQFWIPVSYEAARLRAVREQVKSTELEDV